jgi:peroxiredoxin Q/BCP
MKALLLLSLAFAGCATSPPESSAPPAASPAPAVTTAVAPTAAAPATTTTAPAVATAAATAPATGGDALVGQAAPDFTATAQDGSSVHIAALAGKTVVVYFYPKDETPGCTKEACSFRDAWTSIGKTGAVLVGVSADSIDSHKAFAAHYKLPFLLVSDPDGSIGKKYGVGFEGYHHRETIVIGADGKVRKTYRKVDVAVHAQEILADVSKP